MYKIKTTKQAFDLINDDGLFDEPFVVHESHVYDKHFNVSGLLGIADEKTSASLLKDGENVDYKALANAVKASALYRQYKELNLYPKHIIESGVLNKDEFDADVFGDLSRRKQSVNQMICVTSTEQLQVMIDSGILPIERNKQGSYHFAAAAGLFKGVDFSKLTHPETGDPAKVRLDYAMLVNCNVPKICQVAWSEAYGCSFEPGSTLSQTHLSGQSIDKHCEVGEKALLVNCSSDSGVTVGADSVVYSTGRNPYENTHFGNDCWLIGGVYKNNTYGQDVKADVPTADVLKRAFGSDYLSKRESGKPFWKMSPLTSEEDLEGATTIILPKEVSNIDNMIQYTDTAGRDVKRGIIGRYVSIKVDGMPGAPGAYHGTGPEIRQEFRMNFLESQNNKLHAILDESKPIVESLLTERFKDYFDTEVDVDLFDGAGGEPVYKNKDLIAKVRDSVEKGFVDTLLHARSHKDISNDHVFATNVVDMVKRDVAEALNVGAEQIKERGFRFKFNMESAKRLLREIVDIVPDLNSFNLIRAEQHKEVATIVGDINNEFNEGLSHEDIQAQLAGTWQEPSEIRMIESANSAQIDWLCAMEAKNIELEDDERLEQNGSPSLGF